MDMILSLLTKQFPEYDFTTSDDFISDGYLDSYAIIILITEIENLYNILIDPLDIIPENFMSVISIVNLINKSGGNIIK